MAQIMSLERPHDIPSKGTIPAPAVGLFGYSIVHGELHSSKPLTGYIRDIEQMPNFAPPSMEVFVAQYIASNIGKKASSS